MKKTIRQLEGLEVTIIGTIIRSPETFRQVRDVVRPDMFATEEGRAIAAKVWPLASRGKFSGTILATELDDRLYAMCSHAAGHSDPDNVRTAAELLAGNWAQGKYHEALEQVAMNWNAYADWRDADDILNMAKRDILNMSAGKVTTPAEAIDEVMDDIWAGLLGQKHYSGLPTGFADLDDLTGGWQPGQQIVVGGRPGMGKTRFAVQQAYQASKAGEGVVFFSLEIGRGMIYRYLISLMTGVAVQDMKTYNLPKETADEVSAAAKLLKEMPLWVVDDVFTMEDIEFAAQEIAEQHGVKLIVVDYLQLIGKADTRRTENRNNELSAISRAMKQLARRTNATTMLLSQLSRKATDRPGQIPTMADLRDSGAIEADADVVLFPYRPKEASPENPARVIVEKQRDGETGAVLAEWKSPGFYYPASEEIMQAAPFDPSLNGKVKPGTFDDGQYVPF